MQTTRRHFCAAAGLVSASFALCRTSAASLSEEPIPDVARLDRARIMNHALQYLREKPVTITAYASRRSSGGKHDYFSEGDYWWPDPANPNGPYVQRDGFSNPANFNSHRLALIRLSVQVPALVAAWKLTHEEKFAQHAIRYLRAWFQDSATMMNPNLQFAQAIHGRTLGRGIGIIDTLHLIEVARAIAVLEASSKLTHSELDQIKKWFANYLSWMTNSKNGLEERDAKNNHGTCWVAQAAEFATLTGNRDVRTLCITRFKEQLVPNQIAQDGSFPLELRRTKPYGYSLFNLDAMALVCHILSTDEENLFRFTLPDGRGFAKAIAYMYPFILNKHKWPHAHDVEYWTDWPVRQPSLLFAGIALEKPEYIALWRKLNPDPTIPEIIRNYPIRQPILWV